MELLRPPTATGRDCNAKSQVREVFKNWENHGKLAELWGYVTGLPTQPPAQGGHRDLFVLMELGV